MDDDELATLRALYPAPFSENDTIRQGRNSAKQTTQNYKRNKWQGVALHRFRGRGRGARRYLTSMRPTPSDPELSPPENVEEFSPHPSGSNHPGKAKNTRHKRQVEADPSDPDSSDSDDSNSSGSLPSNDIPPEETPSKPVKPAVFGRTRYSSIDNTFNEKETFVYDPTPRSEEEVMRACFRSIEDLIVSQLYGKPCGIITQ
ncbi:hypothetical protein K435DRAFT_876221 [Dendrothele bispora CBS 962.96]|uniref:Uncharacterized protein n=1 Tax=Dendrothele bispora (strain CBS 962.96) TaxID=1314807 RepID=A0A4S8KSR2_DENBC|nr:hypothetical protein K435DRAFT_876221 [Dendrothele bispora CBS 962.96]